jgi:hypothetical protein
MFHFSQEFPACLYYVRSLMSINIHSLLNIFTKVPKLLQPAEWCVLTDTWLVSRQTQCRDNDFVDVIAEIVGSDGSKILACDILTNRMNNSFVIQQGCLSSIGTIFSWWKAVITRKVSLIVTDLSSKVSCLAHSPCNCEAGTEVGTPCPSILKISISQLHVLCNSTELGDNFD